MSDVPAEILREILSRLPVAPLIRFRCVCKQWRCLIDSNDFVEQHLDHSRKSNSHLSIIMRGKTSLHSIDFDLLNQSNPVSFQQLSHPLKTQYFGPEVLGSSDGLLALSNTEGIIFWNPSVRMFHKLPVTDLPFFGFIVYGFGYDLVCNDYKLVRIFQVYEEGDDDYIESQVIVYNLKSDSWRRISEFPYRLKYKCSHGQLVNGALHWLVSRKAESDTNTLVAAFDLGTEEYRSVLSLPEYASDNVRVNLVVLGGCLSITCTYYMIHVDISVNHVDIWVMKEYGVGESWSILFTVRQSDISFMQFDCLIPIEYSKCGRKVLVLLDGHLLMWYDLDKKSVDLPLPVIQRPIENCYEFYPCLQSLVLLKSGTCDFNIANKKIQNTDSKRRGSGKR